jgi:2-methylcitrate dehydratase PrpD
MHAAEQLAAWSARLRFDEIPEEVVAAAKLHLLDAIGAGLAALALDEMAAARAAALEIGGGEEATVLGLPRRVGAGAAALANGAMMHALDFDDTHERAIVHSSVVVAATVLAAGEAAGASGEELIAAAVGGYEISARIGLAAPGALHARGFHPTSVCGVFAAAAVAARLRGLSAEATANALGVAGSQASGLMEYLADGSQTKPLHAGWAAQAGIVAASLAAHGASGPGSVLEGRFGLLASHVGEFDAAALTAGLGERWETTEIAFKAYPSCHAGHAVLDAVTESGLGEEEPTAIEEVVALVAGEVAVGLVLEPAGRKLAPASAYEAKFSLPYCIGALVARGSLGVDAFSAEAIADERALGLAAKVRYEVAGFDDGNEFSGGIRARAGGRLYEATVPRPRGGPANPMEAAEVHAKFRANAGLALGDEGAARLLAVLDELQRHSAAEVAASTR